MLCEGEEEEEDRVSEPENRVPTEDCGKDAGEGLVLET